MSEKENRVKLARIIVSAILLVIAIAAQRSAVLSTWTCLLAFLPAYLVAGYDVLAGAGRSIVHGGNFGNIARQPTRTIISPGRAHLGR